MAEASVRADTARSALERLRAQHVRVDLFHVSGLLRGVVFDTACHFGASPSAWPRGLRLIGAQMDLLALNKALAVASWTCSLALLTWGQTHRLHDHISTNSAARAVCAAHDGTASRWRQVLRLAGSGDVVGASSALSAFASRSGGAWQLRQRSLAWSC
eukprot:g8226.t2